jgi:hypothetical protein
LISPMVSLVLALQTAGPVPGALSVYDYVQVPEPDAAAERMFRRLEPISTPCAVWRARLPGGEVALLVHLCHEEDDDREAPDWWLYVVTAGARPKRLGRLALGSDYVCNPGNGTLRVRRDVLPGEGVLEVGWGCASVEGDGVFPRVALWRWRAPKLEQIFTVPGSVGGDSNMDGMDWSSWWLPGKPGAGPPAIETIWSYSFLAEGNQLWGGERRFTYRFDGARFRPAPGAILWTEASAWLPPSRVAEYFPPQAIDGRMNTAWCAPGGTELPSLSLDLLEPTTLEALTIVPGYAKSETVFRDNARVARIRVQLERSSCSGEPAPPPFEAELSDSMEPQRVAVPRGSGKVCGVKITVLSVRPGRRYQDVCVAEAGVIPARPSR